MKQPIRFKPFYKQVLWGGDRIAELKNENIGIHQLGESWEISSLAGCESVVDSDDSLKGLRLSDLIQKYSIDILGKSVYERFGSKFPIIIKIIDAKQDLSIQVHPDSKFEKSHPDMPQKNEMWYIIDSKPGAKIICGFNKEIDSEVFLSHIEDNDLLSIVKSYDSKPGQLFYIPAGTIHAIGAGNLIAEIQQASDITFRVYDYNRVDNSGNKRELHIENACQSLDFSQSPSIERNGRILSKTSKAIIDEPYFKVDFLNITEEQTFHFSRKEDTFSVILVTNGDLSIMCNGIQTECTQGNALMIPASINEYIVSGNGKALITYY